MIVVTGASGFIGSALVARLVQVGEEVVGIDRRPPVRAAGAHVVADLADEHPAAVARALTRADVVVHLAGRPGVRDRSPGVELGRHRDNVLAVRQVLAATSAPVIVASSSSVYGGSVDGRACREEDARRPRGGYAASKVGTERKCAARRAGGATVCVVRPFTVVGAGQRPDMALGRWIAAALAGRPIEVYGSLQRSRDLVDVVDAVDVLTALVERAAIGRELPEILNLGTGRARTLGELAEAVQRGVGGPPCPVIARPADADEVDHTLADTTLLAATVGAVPSTDLDDVVAAQLGRIRSAA